MNDVTRLLLEAESGNEHAARDLLPLVYNDLRKLAAVKLARLRSGQTLQPTALVHEVYLRLTGNEASEWENRRHFYYAAAEAMQCYLIDRARKKSRQKRGGNWERIDLENLDLAAEADSDTLLIVHEALEKLSQEAPVKAQLVKLRFFTGLTIESAAQMLGISPATAKRHWNYTRAWLMQEIRALQEERR